MIRLVPALAVLLVAAPASVLAQNAPAPAARTIPGVSPEGMAIVEKYRGKGDIELPGLVREQRTVHQQLVAATLTARIDPERIATLLKQEETAQAAVRARLNGQMIAALRELPEADRAPFLRALLRPTSPAAR